MDAVPERHPWSLIDDVLDADGGLRLRRGHLAYGAAAETGAGTRAFDRRAVGSIRCGPASPRLGRLGDPEVVRRRMMARRSTTPAEQVAGAEIAVEAAANSVGCARRRRTAQAMPAAGLAQRRGRHLAEPAGGAAAVTRRAAAGPAGPGRRLGLPAAPAPARAAAPASRTRRIRTRPRSRRPPRDPPRPARGRRRGRRPSGTAPDRGDVEVMRAEVLDHRDAVVQQGLDVDQVPGPALLLEHATADLVAIGPAGLGALRSIQVVRVGRPDHPLLIDRLGLGGAVVSSGIRTSPSSTPRSDRITTDWPRRSGPPQSGDARNRPT